MHYGQYPEDADEHCVEERLHVRMRRCMPGRARQDQRHCAQATTEIHIEIGWG
jgi:hypothetical protein